jgi:hypothetical protein
MVIKWEPGLLSQYSDGIRAEELGFSPQQGQIFLLSTASSLTLRPKQPPIQWVPAALSPRFKRTGHKADPHLVPKSRMVELYHHSPIRLHGVVLN